MKIFIFEISHNISKSSYACMYVYDIHKYSDFHTENFKSFPLIMAEKSPGIHSEKNGKLCDVILYLLHMML